MPKDMRLETDIMYRLQSFGGHTREKLEDTYWGIDSFRLDNALLTLRNEGLVSCTDGVWWFRAAVVS